MTECTKHEELLGRFRDLSILHYLASEQGDFETVNKGVEETEKIIRELWASGGRTKQALADLAELAKDADPRVAITAIIYTVELYPEVANELKRLRRDKGLVGLAAQYTVKHVKGGNVGWLREVLKDADAAPQ